jgi:hypothetical protein
MINAAMTTIALLLIAGSSGMMSVIGLRTAFAGMPMIITITGIGIEAGKLLLIVYLHRQWKKLGFLARVYNIALVAILVACTSFEIFGMLAQGFTHYNNAVDIAGVEIAGYQKEVDIISADLAHIENKLSYLEESRRKFRAYEYTGYNEKRARRLELQKKIAAAQSMTATKKAKSGSIYSIANVTGIDVKQIAKWLIIVLVAVLEPVSIALTIASSKTWRQAINRRRYLKRQRQAAKTETITKTTARPTIKRAA